VEIYYNPEVPDTPSRIIDPATYFLGRKATILSLDFSQVNPSNFNNFIEMNSSWNPEITAELIRTKSFLKGRGNF
jgi:hypothetical protein